MKSMATLLIAGLLALCGTSAWLASAAEGEKLLPAMASGLVVLSGAVGALLIRRRNEARTGSAAAFSYETEVAKDTQAKAFRDALVLGVALVAAIALFELQSLSAVLLLIYLMTLILDFFIRFQLRLRPQE